MRSPPTPFKLSLCLVLLLFFPAMAQANAGSPLMLAELFHLVLGNAIIGILEGGILAWIFNRTWWKAMAVLIVANYVSAWTGLFALKAIGQLYLPLDINHFFGWFFCLIILAYLMTLFIEFPFVFLVMKPGPTRMKQAIKGSFLIQSISYLLLVSCYGLASPNSLMGNTKVVPLAQLRPSESIVICFIGNGNGRIYEGYLTEGQWTPISDITSNESYGRLILSKQDDNSDHCDLVLTGKFRAPGTLVRKAYAPTTATTWPDHLDGRNREPITKSQNQIPAPWNFGNVLRLGEARESDWSFSTDYWAGWGLRGRNEKSGQSIRFAVETPMVEWNIRDAIHLPGDMVLFQLGDDQICVFDANKNLIALVARGHGPTAILRKLE